jgi:hypothetical protein
MNDLLQFDGLYRHLRGGGNCAWFRFYEDGVSVCGQTTPMSYSQVATWLNRDTQTHCPFSRPDARTLDLELRVKHPNDGTVTSFQRTVHVGEGTIADQAKGEKRSPVELYTFIPMSAKALDPGPGPYNFNRVSYAKLLKLGIPEAHIELLKRGSMSVKVMQSGTAEEISLKNELSLKIAEQIVAWRDGQA